MSTSPTVPLIAPELSVNEVLRYWPHAVRVLDALGIDTCCGGAKSLSVAAAGIGLPVADLIEAIVPRPRSR